MKPKAKVQMSKKSPSSGAEADLRLVINHIKSNLDKAQKSQNIQVPVEQRWGTGGGRRGRKGETWGVKLTNILRAWMKMSA